MLYQVWSLIRTMDECSRPGASIEVAAVRAQADQLILAVIEALEGDEETAVVRHLMKLRRSLDSLESGQELTAEAEAARGEVINIVNNFFYEKLTGLPAIRMYIDRIQQK
jgi:acetolactate synthase small subunit